MTKPEPCETVASNETVWRFMKDLITNAVGKYAQFLVTLATVPVVARELTREQFGLYSLSTASYFFGSAILDFGLSLPLAGRVARLDKSGIQALRREYRLLRACIGMAVLISGLGVGISTSWVYVWLGLCAGAISSSGEEWIYFADRRFGEVVLMQWLGRGVYLVVVLSWIVLSPAAYVPIIALAAGGIVTSGLTWWRVDKGKTGEIARRAGPGLGRQSAAAGIRADINGARRLLKFGWAVMVSRLLSASYSQSSPTLAAVRLSGAALGVYSASDRAVRAVQGALDSLVLTMLPRMADSRARGGVTSRSVWKLVGLAACAGGLGGGALYAAAVPAVAVLYGHGYADVVPVLKLAAAILPISACTSMLVTNVLLMAQRSYAALAVYAAGALVAVIGVVGLGSRGSSASAVVVCMLTGEAVALSVAVVLSLRQARRWEISAGECVACI